MSTLANLTNEECELLVEVLEAEQKALQTQRPDPQTPAATRDQSHRQELLKRLLWDARMGCGTPTPDDAELRELGSYA